MVPVGSHDEVHRGVVEAETANERERSIAYVIRQRVGLERRIPAAPVHGCLGLLLGVDARGEHLIADDHAAQLEGLLDVSLQHARRERRPHGVRLRWQYLRKGKAVPVRCLYTDHLQWLDRAVAAT